MEQWQKSCTTPSHCCFKKKIEVYCCLIVWLRLACSFKKEETEEEEEKHVVVWLRLACCSKNQKEKKQRRRCPATPWQASAQIAKRHSHGSRRWRWTLARVYWRVWHVKSETWVDDCDWVGTLLAVLENEGKKTRSDSVEVHDKTWPMGDYRCLRQSHKQGSTGIHECVWSAARRWRRTQEWQRCLVR